MTRTFGLVLVILSVLSFSVQNAQPASDGFPSADGTCWIYRGFVRWTHDQSNEVSQTPVTWRMNVRRVIRRPDVTALVINGFPSDLDWSDGAVTPQDSLIIQTADHKVYRIDAQNFSSAMNQLQDVQDKLAGLLNEDNLLFQLPLKEGNKFCDPENKSRDDGMYCWLVDSSRVISLEQVPGAPFGRHAVFTLVYRTNPDDEEFEFAPGIGITSYEYHHHGTVADTELKLAEMHADVIQKSARTNRN